MTVRGSLASMESISIRSVKEPSAYLNESRLVGFIEDSRKSSSVPRHRVCSMIYRRHPQVGQPWLNRGLIEWWPSSPPHLFSPFSQPFIFYLSSSPPFLHNLHLASVSRELQQVHLRGISRAESGSAGNGSKCVSCFLGKQSASSSTRRERVQRDRRFEMMRFSVVSFLLLSLTSIIALRSVGRIFFFFFFFACNASDRKQ